MNEYERHYKAVDVPPQVLLLRGEIKLSDVACVWEQLEAEYLMEASMIALYGIERRWAIEWVYADGSTFVDERIYWK